MPFTPDTVGANARRQLAKRMLSSGFIAELSQQRPGAATNFTGTIYTGKYQRSQRTAYFYGSPPEGTGAVIAATDYGFAVNLFDVLIPEDLPVTVGNLAVISDGQNEYRLSIDDVQRSELGLTRMTLRLRVFALPAGTISGIPLAIPGTPVLEATPTQWQWRGVGGNPIPRFEYYFEWPDGHRSTTAETVARRVVYPQPGRLVAGATFTGRNVADGGATIRTLTGATGGVTSLTTSVGSGRAFGADSDFYTTFISMVFRSGTAAAQLIRPGHFFRVRQGTNNLFTRQITIYPYSAQASPPLGTEYPDAAIWAYARAVFGSQLLLFLPNTITGWQYTYDAGRYTSLRIPALPYTWEVFDGDPATAGRTGDPTIFVRAVNDLGASPWVSLVRQPAGG